jgi:hypothetical protein
MVTVSNQQQHDRHTRTSSIKTCLASRQSRIIAIGVTALTVVAGFCGHVVNHVPTSSTAAAYKTSAVAQRSSTQARNQPLTVSRDSYRNDILSEAVSTSSEGSWSLGGSEDQIGDNLKKSADQQTAAITALQQLRDLIHAHDDAKSSDYTSTSWSTYQQSIQAANNLVSSSSKDMDAIAKANTDLTQSYASLQRPQAPATTTNTSSNTTSNGTSSNTSSTGVVTAPTSEIQSYAHDQVLSRGWSEDDFTALVALWTKESGWNPNSKNSSSGAYGIPQCLGHAECQTDAYRTSYKVQVDWGLQYIAGRYGSPSSAMAHSRSTGWY